MADRILHLIDNLHLGGSECQAVQLVRNLAGIASYEIHVACLNGGGMLRSDLENAGFRDIPEFPLTSFHDANALRQIRRFAAEARRLGIALIHTHDFYTNLFGMAGAVLAGIPFRVASRRETTGTRTGAQKVAEHWAYRLAQCVIANAEAVGRQLLTEGIRAAKIAVVHNGLDLDRFSLDPTFSPPEWRTRLGLPATGRRFVTLVANLIHPIKDHGTFLRAARLVRRAVPDAAFAIAGDGPLREATRRQAEECGVAADVFFLGKCAAIPQLLALSDIGVLCSRAEGFSNAILEYMAAGRPVVATDVGGAAEAVIEGESGYLVPPGADVLLASRIITLLQNPKLARRMGRKGREIVERKFSCDAQVTSTRTIYDRLLHSR